MIISVAYKDDKLIYLLDANTLINAKNFYYPIDRVPEYWEWLVYQGGIGNVKIPVEIFEEFKDTKDKNGDMDELAIWASREDVVEYLLLSEDANMEAVRAVTYKGYVANPTDSEIEKMGRDPFLISYAYIDRKNRCVVTAEVSKPTKQGANRRVPDVCNILGVRHIDSYQLIRELNFTTNWGG